ncbi:MAG: hypothetical protein K0R31_1910, partial [Clostridiales bacterium]|nr:hypothetical protein [Clostridiales bacterium]
KNALETAKKSIDEVKEKVEKIKDNKEQDCCCGEAKDEAACGSEPEKVNEDC